MMRSRLVLAITLILGISFLAPSLHSVSAAEGDTVVSIRPSEQDLEFTPGKTYQESVRVYNVGNKAFDFTVESSPYQVESGSYEPDFLSESSYTKLANWISFDQLSYHVEPDTSVNIEFTVRVPEDVPGGGQYAAIIIRIDPATSGESGVGILTQLAAILHGHIKGEEARLAGELVSSNFPNVFISSPFTNSLTFTNTGNVDYRVRTSWTIRDFFTNRELITPTTTTEKGYLLGYLDVVVLPNTERTVRLTWSDAPPIGLYRVEQDISYLDHQETIQRVVFLCPLWLVILIIAFFALAIIWLIIRIIERRRSTPQVF